LKRETRCPTLSQEDTRDANVEDRFWRAPALWCFFYACLPFFFGFGPSDWHDFHGTDLFVVLPAILFPWFVAGTFFGIRSIAGSSSYNAYIVYFISSLLIVSLLIPLYYFFGIFLGPKRG
jgi:hypothetical protein